MGGTRSFISSAGGCGDHRGCVSRPMGSSNSNEAEVSAAAAARRKKLNDDLDRIEAQEAERQRALDAETIPLNMNGPDGKFDHDARLNGTLQELTEKVVLKLGLIKECAEHVEMHLSGYKLEPVTKIVREFTELCAGSEIDLEGIEKAQEAMQKHKAAKLDVHAAAIDGNLAQLNLVVQFAPERINEANGDTPLHYAVGRGQEAAVSLLLSAKADVNKTNSYGETPLDWAEGDRVKQLLRDAGGY